MGWLNKLKEGFSRGVEKVSGFGKTVLEYAEKGAVMLGWNETAERCRSGIEACEESRIKWKDRADRFQADNKFGKQEKPPTYRPDSRQREIENKCISLVEDKLHGHKMDDVLRSHTPEQRLEFIEEVAKDATTAFGIKMEPVQYYSGDSSLGFYNREDNRIYLNEAYVTCDNIYFVKEQIFTLFHESMHAAQWQAVKDLAQGGNGMGFSKERLLEWAENFDHYIRPEVDFEAYRNQPLERDAFGLEWRMKDFF